MFRVRDAGAPLRRAALLEVAFDFELMSTKACSFVPVKFYSTDSPVLQSYPSGTFAFAPAAATVDSLKTP